MSSRRSLPSPLPTPHSLLAWLFVVAGLAVVGRLAPVANQDCAAVGAEDGRLGARQGLVGVGRGGAVRGPAAFADQRMFAVRTIDHGMTSFRENGRRLSSRPSRPSS